MVTADEARCGPHRPGARRRPAIPRAGLGGGAGGGDPALSPGINNFFAGDAFNWLHNAVRTIDPRPVPGRAVQLRAPRAALFFILNYLVSGFRFPVFFLSLPHPPRQRAPGRPVGVALGGGRGRGAARGPAVGCELPARRGRLPPLRGRRSIGADVRPGGAAPVHPRPLPGGWCVSSPGPLLQGECDRVSGRRRGLGLLFVRRERRWRRALETLPMFGAVGLFVPLLVWMRADQPPLPGHLVGGCSALHRAVAVLRGSGRDLLEQEVSAGGPLLPLWLAFLLLAAAVALVWRMPPRYRLDPCGSPSPWCRPCSCPSRPPLPLCAAGGGGLAGGCDGHRPAARAADGAGAGGRCGRPPAPMSCTWATRPGAMAVEGRDYGLMGELFTAGPRSPSSGARCRSCSGIRRA